MVGMKKMNRKSLNNIRKKREREREHGPGRFTVLQWMAPCREVGKNFQKKKKINKIIFTGKINI